MFITSNPQDDRQKNRLMFRDAWHKQVYGLSMTPLEKQIASVVEEHPEYHKLLDDEEAVQHGEFTPEQGRENPFLHMGLHLGLREQVGTDRPAGIQSITRALLIKHNGEGHEVEHRMMDCLAEFLWLSQRNNTPPDELAYMENLKRLL